MGERDVGGEQSQAGTARRSSRRVGRVAGGWLRIAAIAACTAPAADAAAQVARLRAVEALRIGSEDAPHTALTNVSDLLVGHDGSIYVAQPLEKVVRVFRADGRFVRMVGRAGEGPGEFRQPEKLGWRGDTLWVSDFHARRTSFFSASGEFLNSISFTHDASVRGRFFVYVPWQPLADGSVLGGKVRAPEGYRAGAAVRVPELRFTRRGEVLDTLAVLPAGHTSLVIERRGGPPVVGPQPFADDPLLAVAPDGDWIAIVHRSAATPSDNVFTVEKRSPAGQVLYRRAYRYAPVPVREREIQAAFARLSAATAGMGGAGGDLRRWVYVPAHRPPVTEVVAGRDGTLWLRREAREGAAIWNVLDPQGTLIALVEVPARVRILQAQRDRLWGVDHDELDVPYVVRYRLAPVRPARR